MVEGPFHGSPLGMESKTVFGALSLCFRAALLAGAPVLGACGGSTPRVSLVQLMYQVDYDDQRLRAALGRGDLATARELSGQLRASFASPAFEQYLQRSDLLAPAERFQESRRSFGAALDELLAAIDDDDAGRADEQYARMRRSCEDCHRDFRPGL